MGGEGGEGGGRGRRGGRWEGREVGGEEGEGREEGREMGGEEGERREVGGRERRRWEGKKGRGGREGRRWEGKKGRGALLHPSGTDNIPLWWVWSQRLSVYLFDDLAPVETSCMGVAEVPLLPLAENRSIDGLFALKEVCSCSR